MAKAARMAQFVATRDMVLLNFAVRDGSVPSNLKSLWQLLRCATLHHVGAAARRRDAASVDVDASTIVQDVVAAVRKSMAVDCFLMKNGGRSSASSAGGLHLPQVTLEDFRSKWGEDGALYRVVGGVAFVLFTETHPVTGL